MMALRHGSATRLIALCIGLAAVAALGHARGHLGSHVSGRLHQLFGIEPAAGADVGGFGAAGSGAAVAGAIDPASMPVPPTVIGMNMAGQAYYSTQAVFNDPIQSSGELFYFVGAAPQPVRFAGQTATDLNGRPIDVPKGTRFLMRVQNDGRPFIGKLDCSVAPGWEVISGSRWVKVSQSGTHFTVFGPESQPGDHRFELGLNATTDRASLSTLGCAKPGATGLFNPAFLDDNRPFRILRFMDWMHTNNEPLRIWAERATPHTLSQAGEKGVSLEDMVALCSELTCDPWFTLPWDAEPGYYRNFATYVRDHLPKDRKVYVELSNEVWNPGFLQSRLATQLGQQKYPGVGPTEANAYYYADRVRALMKIWDDVFAGQQGRLVRVYASQAAWAARAGIGLAHEDTWRSVDVLAEAPYLIQFLQMLPGSGQARIDATFAKAPELIDKAMQWSLADKAVAQKFKLRLVTYEGGQHFFAFTPDANADLKAVESDPRMYDLYTSYLNRWKREIGGPLVLYDSVGLGTFEHKAYTGQPLAEAPKMRAVIDFINRNK